jgi:hypothetical protein
VGRSDDEPIMGTIGKVRTTIDHEATAFADGDDRRFSIVTLILHLLGRSDASREK